MNDQDGYCPHCGQPLGDDASESRPTKDPTGRISEVEAEPGIIRATDSGEIETFNLVRINDLNGDPYHDWPLIAARFRNSLPWLVEVILSDPKTARYLKGRITEDAQARGPEPAPPSRHSQLWQDLDMVRPYLPNIIQNGQFTYGHQSRIAEALDVPNQGSYRRRIQNVVSALERTLIRKFSTSSTAGPAAVQPENEGQNRKVA